MVPLVPRPLRHLSKMHRFLWSCRTWPAMLNRWPVSPPWNSWKTKLFAIAKRQFSPISIYIIYIIRKKCQLDLDFFIFKWRFQMLFVVEISPHPRKSDPISRRPLSCNFCGRSWIPAARRLGRWSTETWRSPRRTFFCLRFLGLPSLPHLIG